MIHNFYLYKFHHYLGLSLVGREWVDIYYFLADLSIFIMEGFCFTAIGELCVWLATS
jgi:hypothetical protein